MFLGGAAISVWFCDARQQNLFRICTILFGKSVFMLILFYLVEKEADRFAGSH